MFATNVAKTAADNMKKLNIASNEFLFLAKN